MTASADSPVHGWVRPHLKSLSPYQPGKPVAELERELGITNAIKMASNENPLGPSPLGIAAATKALASGHLYPDAGVFELRRSVGERLGVSPADLVFGAGSNELIYLFVAAFAGPGQEVLSHANSFISYRLAAMAHGATFVETPVTADLRCDVAALCTAMGPKTKVIFIGNPNNPTGAHLSSAELETIAAALPPQALLIVDEAYFDYAVGDASYGEGLGLRDRLGERLVVLRTFSKSYGLAGLRVGFGVCGSVVADYIHRLRRPFNVNAIAQAAALAALDDGAHVARGVALAHEGVAVLSAAAEQAGVRAYPSLTNFVLLDVKRPGGEVYDGLLARGVIARPMSAWGLPSHIRISVGTAQENERAAVALRAVLG